MREPGLAGRRGRPWPNERWPGKSWRTDRSRGHHSVGDDRPVSASAQAGAVLCSGGSPVVAGLNQQGAGRVCSLGAANVDPETGTRGVADAPLAQSAERLHGKEKVYGSIP